ncbi:MAG: D-alanine--D-alanine ligase [Candidatus Omnitrophota bacterium]
MYSNLGKVGVIYGGLSSERDISLKSGEAILGALLKEGLDAEAVDLKTEDPKSVEQIIQDTHIDIAFIAMHGKFGEDGKLQAILENMGVNFVGSDSLASSFAMDKIISKKLFEENNIPTPRYTTLNRLNNLMLDQVTFPVIVKPQSQGSSIGITFVNDASEIEKALKCAFRYDDSIILEEYVKGRELTVSILDNKALEPIEILPKNKLFDFQAKYSKGLTDYILPANINSNLRSKVQRLSLNAHKALGCRHFSRIDLILDEHNNPFILELNTIPGFTSTSLLPKAASYEGIDFQQLCIKLLTLAARDAVTTLNK